MNHVLRQEKKYLLSLEECYQLKNHLDQLLHGDPHNGPKGYMVRSLYFDTLSDKDYYNKEDGLELRRKIRLRCYSPDSDRAALEIKQKQGAQQLKRSLTLGREAATRMAKGDYSPLLAVTGRESDFAMECYGLLNELCYRPKVIVEYERMAYMAKENHIRITLDQNVRASEGRTDIFAEKLPLNPVLPQTSVILEVKYNEFLLSYIKQIVNIVNRSELSVSKYNLARQTVRRINV